MTIDVKRLLRPITYAGTGLLSLIFMFINYIALWTSETGTLDAKSAYALLGFPSIDTGFNAFLTVLLGIALILLLLVSIALLAIGVIELIQEFANVDVLGSLNASLVDNVPKLLMTGFFFINIVAAALAFLISLISLESGFGMLMGMVPGIGVFFLLALAIVPKILLPKLEAKFADTPDAVRMTYRCSSCGVSASKNDKFCKKCGAPIVAAQVERITYQCSGCGTNASKNDKFCKKCGSPIVAVKATIYQCSACQAPASSADKFCKKCGAPVIAVNGNDTTNPQA